MLVGLQSLGKSGKKTSQMQTLEIDLDGAESASRTTT